VIDLTDRIVLVTGAGGGIGTATARALSEAGAGVAVSVPRYWPERVFWTLSWDYWHTPGGHIRMYRPGEMARHLREQGFDLHAVRYRHAFQSFYWFLRCIFGKNNERRWLPYTAFRFINWHHRTRVPLLERIERLLVLFAQEDVGEEPILCGFPDDERQQG